MVRLIVHMMVDLMVHLMADLKLHSLIDSILASLALTLIDNQVSYITVVEKKPTSRVIL